MTKLRILIADDHELVRRGVRSLLESHADWEIVAEAADGAEAVQACKDSNPDLAILDIGMPNLDGMEATRQILALNPQIRVLILTMHDSEQVIREVIAAGARGFLSKADAGRDLIKAVEALQTHRTFFNSEAAELILNYYLGGNRTTDSVSKGILTQREREVAQLLAEGKKTKEVAMSLHLSVKTAETHRTNIMRKLNLHSIADLTLYAVRNGIIRLY